MARLWWSKAAGLVVVATVMTWAAPAQAQVAVVTLKSIDALFGDVKYVLKLVDRENQAEQLDGFLKALTGGKGLGGIDTKRPIGAFLDLPMQIGSPPGVTAFIPVTKPDEFLDFLKAVGCDVEKGKEGEPFAVTLPTPKPFKVYARFANDHAYASDNADRLKGKLTDPATVMPAVSKENLLAASVRFDQIPDAYKQLAKIGLEGAIAAAQQPKRQGESETEFQARSAAVKLGKDVALSLLDDAKEITITVNIDHEKNQVAIEYSLAARPGSALAKSIESFGAARSMFSPLVKDSAASLLVHLPLADALQKEIAKLADVAYAEGLKEIKDAKVQEIVQKVFKAVEPTIKSDAIDFGAALRGPLAENKYVVLVGTRVREGKKLDQVIRDLVKELPIPDKTKIKLDHDKAADGTAIHLVQPPGIDDEARRIIGTNDIYVAVRDDVAMVAVGQHGATALKEALSVVGKAKDAATAPVQVEVSAGRLAPLAPEDQEKLAEAVKKVFGGADKGKDKVRLSLRGGDALRLRLEADAHLLKLIPHVIPFGAE